MTGSPTRNELTFKVMRADDLPLHLEGRILVDGRDVAAAVVPEGAGPDADELLDALRAGPAARNVRLVTTGCPAPQCHGTLDVRVRRAGDTVVWDAWWTEGAGADAGRVPGTTTFDAATYDAELDRADAELAEAPPARLVARHLRRGELAEVLADWSCGLDMVLPSGDSVRVTWENPDRSFGSLDLELTAEPPGIQAGRAVDALRRTGPRAPSPPPGWSAPRR
jgi:hypothetical protein